MRYWLLVLAMKQLTSMMIISTHQAAIKLIANIFNSTHILCGRLRPDHDSFEVALTNYPKPWLDNYTLNKWHRIDPVAHNLRTALKLFPWGQSQFKSNRKLQELYIQASSYNMSCGLVVRFADANFIALASSQTEQDHNKFLKSERIALMPKLFMLNSYLNVIDQPHYCPQLAAQLLDLMKQAHQHQMRRQQRLKTALHFCKAFAMEIDMTLPGVARHNLLLSFRELYKHFIKL